MLTESGEICEGNATLVEGAGLSLLLKGYEGDRIVPRSVEATMESDGSFRTRIASEAVVLELRQTK